MDQVSSTHKPTKSVAFAVISALKCIFTGRVNICSCNSCHSIRILLLPCQCVASSRSAFSLQRYAIVTPLLKKAADIYNFQPLSNLTFMSKVVERAVAARSNDPTSQHIGRCIQLKWQCSESGLILCWPRTPDKLRCLVS